MHEKKKVVFVKSSLDDLTRMKIKNNEMYRIIVNEEKINGATIAIFKLICYINGSNNLDYQTVTILYKYVYQQIKRNAK